MKMNEKINQRINELARSIVLSVTQTIVNIPIFMIGVKLSSLEPLALSLKFLCLFLQMGIAYLSACTVMTWLYCVVEFLDIKKMLKELNE